jgi:HD domain
MACRVADVTFSLPPRLPLHLLQWGDMQGQPTGFWGKLAQDNDGKVERWHPLEDHCADVAACCEALLKCLLIRRRLAMLAGRVDLNESDVQRSPRFSTLPARPCRPPRIPHPFRRRGFFAPGRRGPRVLARGIGNAAGGGRLAGSPTRRLSRT